MINRKEELKSVVKQQNKHNGESFEKGRLNIEICHIRIDILSTCCLLNILEKVRVKTMKINKEKLENELKGFLGDSSYRITGQNSEIYIKKTVVSSSRNVALLTDKTLSFDFGGYEQLHEKEKYFVQEVVYRHIANSYDTVGRAKPDWSGDWTDVFLCRDICTGKYSYLSDTGLNKDKLSVFTESELRRIEIELEIPIGTHVIETI